MIHRLILRVYCKLQQSRGVGILIIALLMLIALIGNAATFYYFENEVKQQANEALYTIEDALWYSVISITTIGYGDYSASTTGARLGTVFFVIIVGLGTFTFIIGMITDFVTSLALKGQRGMVNATASNHILIVNFPSAARVKQIIEEIQSDPGYSRDIVIITDQIEKLPFEFAKVQFVQGSPLEAETYERANAAKAAKALILSPNYNDPNSDAISSSIVSVIESINSDVRTIAECMDRKHLILFESSDCDSIILGQQIAGNLLVQEMHDPGAARFVDVITSNQKGTTLFSTTIEEPQPPIHINGVRMDYNFMAKALLDHGINLLGIERRESVHTTFADLKPHGDDILVYIADKRYAWKDLVKATKGAAAVDAIAAELT